MKSGMEETCRTAAKIDGRLRKGSIAGTSGHLRCRVGDAFLGHLLRRRHVLCDSLRYWQVVYPANVLLGCFKHGLHRFVERLQLRIQLAAHIVIKLALRFPTIVPASSRMSRFNWIFLRTLDASKATRPRRRLYRQLPTPDSSLPAYSFDTTSRVPGRLSATVVTATVVTAPVTIAVPIPSPAAAAPSFVHPHGGVVLASPSPM